LSHSSTRKIDLFATKQKKGIIFSSNIRWGGELSTQAILQYRFRECLFGVKNNDFVKCLYLVSQVLAISTMWSQFQVILQAIPWTVD
jgi:hypothetical protein